LGNDALLALHSFSTSNNSGMHENLVHFFTHIIGKGGPSSRRDKAGELRGASDTTHALRRMMEIDR
jgi:hypothetical protein